MHIRTNEEVILDLLSAIEERDLERILAMCHPELEFHWPTALPYGGSSKGFGESETPTWQDSWLPLQPTAAERSMDCRIIASHGDDVVALYHQRGRDRNGNVIDDQVIGLYTLEGGKLRRAQMFYYNLDAVVGFLATAGVADDEQ
jgi:ketosteroid isomerase-like protein